MGEYTQLCTKQIQIVGLSNILYRERKETLTRRSPSEGTHGTGVAGTLVGSELPTKVGEGVETVVGVETFLVFAVAAFDLAVVTGRVGADQLVEDTEFSGGAFKQRRKIPPGIGETIGKLETIVRLDTFDFHAFAGKGLENLPEEVGGGVGTLLGVRAQDTVTGILVNGGILVQLQLRIRNAAARHDLDVDLDALSRVLHLLVGLGAILLLWLFLLCHSLAAQNPPQAFDAAAVASFSQPCPQLHHADPGIPAVHVADECQLLLRVLVGMVVRPSEKT